MCKLCLINRQTTADKKGIKAHFKMENSGVLELDKATCQEAMLDVEDKVV